MRNFRSPLASVSSLAIIIALLAPLSPAAAQAVPPTTPQSVTQDDEATATPEQTGDTQATTAESADPLETGSDDNLIVVTGSRIARPEFAFPNPVQAYTSEAIQQAGATNITDFLVDSPALVGSLTNADVAGSNLLQNQLVGVNRLNLRNLGTNRTLVLVNGRRHVAGTTGSAAVDVSTIPVELIERVDVLTGGTSAIYGADGVSGVVNFVLKRDFEGLSVRGQSGISQRGDAGDRFFAITAGHNFGDDRGNVTFAYEFNDTDRFSQLKRLSYGRTGPTFRFVTNPADPDDLDPNLPDNVPLRDLRWADTSPGGAIDLDYDFVPDFTGEGAPYDVGEYVANEPFTIGGDSTLQEIYFGDIIPKTKRHIFNGLASFEFSPALRVFVEGKFVKAKAHTLSQPSYDLYVELYEDNAYLNERFPGMVSGTALVTGRDNFDFGIRRSASERETIRTVLGADGELSENLRYELSYVFGQLKSESTDTNGRIRDRYYAALDAVVDPSTGEATCRINLPGETMIRNYTYIATQAYGTLNPATGYYEGPAVSFNPGECVPLNYLGSGTPSQEALNFILADNRDSARIRQHVLSGSVSGDTEAFLNLPGGPIGFALGVEYRKESLRYTPSDLAEAGLLLDASQTSADRGSFNVKEVFGEINVPILKDIPFAKTLSIGGAVRLSDYSTIGSTKTWSVNGVYAPVRDLTFRGTVSQAVRAPNLNELFGTPTGTYEFIDDPCGIDRIGDGTASRLANCTAALAALGIDINDVDPVEPGAQPFDPADDATSPGNTSLLGRTGGNRGLSEETARTWTAGIVLRPRFIPGLNIAADWYDIKIKKAINTPTAQELIELCVDQPSLDNIFCPNQSRDPASGFVTDFLVQPDNVASFDTEGLDVSLNYRFRPAKLGTFNIRVNGNYLHKLEFIPTVGADIDDDRTEAFAPKYSANADLTWTKGPVTLNYGINYFSKTLRYSLEETEADPDIVADKYLYFKERWEHQVQAAFDVDERFNIYAGINNLLDTKPDVGSVNYPVGAVGRFFYLGVRANIF